jgi:hypothetical protein
VFLTAFFLYVAYDGACLFPPKLPIGLLLNTGCMVRKMIIETNMAARNFIDLKIIKSGFRI